MQTGYPCPYCGFTDHPEDANYCGKCGKSIRFSHNPLIRIFGKYKNSIIDERDLSNIPRPFIGLQDYHPIEFEVVKSIVYNNISNRYDDMSKKINEIKDIIKVEQQSNKKLFGGKSRTEILNRINDILS